ncbi:MAG TPA: FAD-dependent monooxygenase [Streptosporangiaceae bacterium]|nr:FAD-dependent monooxygenase [Streptosporangiaceae bacterium]
MDRTLRIAVIGGGIGGLTAARALLRRGFEVHVYESSPELREIGAGVALGPNAMKALRSLELEAPVRSVGYQAPFQLLRTWKGRMISKTDATLAAQRFGANGCTIHRADLLDVLARSVPADVVTLSARCEAVTASDSAAAARFTDGTEIEADVIVGADGIHSAVRASLFGPDAPQFTGKICYRSVIPVADLPASSIEPYEGLWLGPHGTLVIYGVRRGELINVVAHYEDATYQHESWIAECDRAEILERYRRWHPSLREIFAVGDVWYKWALYDRDPIPAWTRGRATILGDAAHPMLPYLGQGAGQAIEDGCVLAAALDNLSDDPVGALQLYERSRRPRASRVVLTARSRGDDNHLVSPIAALRRDLAIAVRKRLGADVTGRGEGWIAEYDAGSPGALVG